MVNRAVGASVMFRYCRHSSAGGWLLFLVVIALAESVAVGNFLLPAALAAVVVAAELDARYGRRRVSRRR